MPEARQQVELAMISVTANLGFRLALICSAVSQAEGPGRQRGDSFRQHVEQVQAQVVQLAADRAIDSEVVDDYFCRVAKLQVAGGCCSEALQTSALIQEKFVRSMALYSIVAWHSKGGDFETCQALISDFVRREPGTVPDSAIDDGALNLCEIAVENFCGLLRFDDAVQIAKLRTDLIDQQRMLTEIARRAGKLGQSATCERLLAELGAAHQCDVLTEMAVDAWERFQSAERAHRPLDRAVSLLPVIDNPDLRRLATIRLCVCLDAMNEADAANQLMSQLTDPADLGACAMFRAIDNARRGRFDELQRCLEISRQFQSPPGVFGVLGPTVEAGNPELAIRLALKYSSPEQLGSHLKEGVVEPSLKRGDWETAFSASQMLRTPSERIRSVLRTLKFAIADAGRDQRVTPKLRLWLTEAESEIAALDELADRIRATASLATLWHALGDDVRARGLLESLMNSISSQSEFREALRNNRFAFFELISALDGLQRTADVDVILALGSDEDALRWRTDRLCDRGRFTEALDLLQTSEPTPLSLSLQHDVLGRASASDDADWALAQATTLPGDLQTRIERQVIVLEAMMERLHSESETSR